MSALGTVIRTAREAAGLSRAQLADRARISAVFVSKIEQGVKGPSPSTLVRLANALGVTAVELQSRAAVLEAGEANDHQEYRRRVLRAVATGGATAAALLSPVTFGTAGIAAAVAMGLRQHRRTSVNADSANREPREELLDLIEGLSDAEIQIILEAARRGPAPDDED